MRGHKKVAHKWHACSYCPNQPSIMFTDPKCKRKRSDGTNGETVHRETKKIEDLVKRKRSDTSSTRQGKPSAIVKGRWEGEGWYDDKSDKVPVIWEEAPKSIIHEGEEEARRANVPNMKGDRSEASIVLDQWSASNSIDIKVIWYWGAKIMNRVREKGTKGVTTTWVVACLHNYFQHMSLGWFYLPQ